MKSVVKDFTKDNDAEMYINVLIKKLVFLTLRVTPPAKMKALGITMGSKTFQIEPSERSPKGRFLLPNGGLHLVRPDSVSYSLIGFMVA